jgi:hypothetical protein
MEIIKKSFINQFLLPIAKPVLFFSGTAVIALLLSVFLHELGHATAVWLTEKQVARISFNPFAGAVIHYTTGGGTPAAARFVASAGFLLGGIYALLGAGLFLLRFQNRWTTPLAMVPAMFFSTNGFMLLVGVFFVKVGDTSRLLGLGVLKAELALVGIFLSLLGFLFFLLVSPWVALDPRVSIQKRYTIFLGGIAPYIAAVLGYNAFFNMARLWAYFVYVFIGVSLGLGALLLSGLLPRRVTASSAKPVGPLEWKHVIFVSGLALILILIPLFCKP